MDDAAPRSRPGAFLPSLVAALGILAYVAIATSVSTAVGQLAYMSELSAEYFFVEFMRTAALYLAFAVACLLSFWLIAPILARLSIRQVIIRVLVVAGVAFVLLVPVQFAILSAMYAETEPSDSGGLTDLVELTPEPNVLLIAVGSTLQFAISRLPEIALGAFGLRWWLRRKDTAHGQA